MRFEIGDKVTHVDFPNDVGNRVKVAQTFFGESIASAALINYFFNIVCL